MAKSQLIENIDETCGGSLRSKKMAFLRVPPQTVTNLLIHKDNSLRSNCGGTRSNCGGETPPYPPCAFLRTALGKGRCTERTERVLCHEPFGSDRIKGVPS